MILARKVKASRFQNYVAPGLIVHHVNSSVISSVLSASRAQRHAVDSKFYYHTVYGGVPSAVATLLFVLYPIWLGENAILNVCRKIRNVFLKK